jgi:putative salt-induced outer membrane protein
MKNRRLLSGAATAALVLTGAQAAYAQDSRLGTRPAASAVQSQIGTTDASESIQDIELRTQRELALAQDEARFGTSGIPQGFRGSLSFTGVATAGNTETTDVGIGGRFTLGQGAINHTFGLAVEYGEAENVRDRNRVLGIYDLSYDLSDRFYVFGLARGEYDEFASRNEVDAFAGVGPGFRILNQPDLAWRVQAGPGVRYTKEIEDGDTETELAGILSSRFYYQVTNDMFVTNDTDVLHSSADTLVSNEIALNTRIAGPISGRVGLRTDYSTDPAEGQKSTDNRLSVGVVYSFAP